MNEGYYEIDQLPDGEPIIGIRYRKNGSKMYDVYMTNRIDQAPNILLELIETVTTEDDAIDVAERIDKGLV